MQFKIKEMKGMADCEWFYKQDSQGALRRQFCKRFWLQSLGRMGWEVLQGPSAWESGPERAGLSAEKLTFCIQIGGSGGHHTAQWESESGEGSQKA